jgi:hypothetical protein
MKPAPKAPPAPPAEPVPPEQPALKIGPGTFPKEDVAFGIARPGGRSNVLVEFAGEATPGTRAPLSVATSSMASGEEKNAAIAVDTLRFAENLLREHGGRIRFNLEGFSIADAINEKSPNFWKVTSAEFRGILNNAFLKSRTDFFDKGIDVTERVHKEAVRR